MKISELDTCFSFLQISTASHIFKSLIAATAILEEKAELDTSQFDTHSLDLALSEVEEQGDPPPAASFVSGLMLIIAFSIYRNLYHAINHSHHLPSNMSNAIFITLI